MLIGFCLRATASDEHAGLFVGSLPRLRIANETYIGPAGAISTKYRRNHLSVRPVPEGHYAASQTKVPRPDALDGGRPIPAAVLDFVPKFGKLLTKLIVFRENIHKPLSLRGNVPADGTLLCQKT
jgi:hypothetical protein